MPFHFKPPLLSNVPHFLKSMRWGVWTAEPRGDQVGKYNKAPRSPSSGRKCAANDPSQFATFEEAARAFESGRYSGVGVILDGSGVVAVDIDDVKSQLEQNHALRRWLQKTLAEGAYCEFSPSGSGLHLYLDGELPEARGRKKGGLEIYSTGRFMTVTGHIFSIPDDRSRV